MTTTKAIRADEAQKESGRMYTPWGFSQDVKTVAPGILFVSTPSHGGFFLDPDRNAKIPPTLRAWAESWAGPGWYEEDCCWAAVAVTFPELFRPQEVEAARRTIAGIGWANLPKP